jgi:hypothetical protein
MPIVSECTAHGCETLTIGLLCVDHDSRVRRTFVRGRPFVRKSVELRLTTATGVFAPSLRTASGRPAAVPTLR